MGSLDTDYSDNTSHLKTLQQSDGTDGEIRISQCQCQTGRTSLCSYVPEEFLFLIISHYSNDNRSREDQASSNTEFIIE